MLPKQEAKFERLDEVTKPGWRVMRRGFRRLKTKYSGAHNALYGENDQLRVIAGMSDATCYAEISVDRARSVEKMHKKNNRARIPSPQWTLAKIRDTGDEGAETRCRNMVRDSVRAAKKVGMLKGRIVVAIDSNLKEYYGETKSNDEDEDEDPDKVPMTVRSRSKNGTNDFIGHIAMQGIGPKSKVFLGARHLEPGSDIPGLVGSLLGELDRLDIKAMMALLDRGHFSVRNMQAVDTAGLWFIMPAVKNSRIKKIIAEHAGDKGPVVVEYTLRSKDGEFPFRLIICKRAGYKGSDPVEGHMVFATNMTRYTCLKYFDMIPDDYKARWEIETGFRCIEEVQGKTRSRSLVVRLALFYFSLLFYNAWTISRFLETDGGDPRLWPRCITLAQFSLSIMSLFRPLLCPDTAAPASNA